MPSALVIGAGPSGLVTLKYLLEEGFDAQIWEATDVIGGTFVSKAYEHGHLVSSKHLTEFSDFRSPSESGAHLNMAEYVEYLHNYAIANNLLPHILFNTSVESVQRVVGGTNDGKVYKVSDDKGNSRTVDAVAVASGVHNIPRIPRLFQNFKKKFTGEVLHSSDYKSAKQLAGKRVVVVGSQETGMDVANFAVTQPEDDFKSVTMIYRRGFLSIPHLISGKPLDTNITNAFESCYQHRWVEQGGGTFVSGIKWGFATYFIRIGLLLGTGSSVGWNQWTGEVKHVKRGYNYITKSTEAMKYINVPFKKNSWFAFLHRRLDGDMIPDRQIDTHRAEIVQLGDDNGVASDKLHLMLANTGERKQIQADVVVLCTGYLQRFPFLQDDTSETNKHITDHHTEEDIDSLLPAEHLILNPEEPRLAFIGFVRPNVGAIPPMSELQAMYWIQRMKGAITGPKKPHTRDTYTLRAAKHEYSVDYGQYMHELARDIEAAPDMLTGRFSFWRDPKIFIAYMFGQSLSPFFRLQGPFAKEACVDIARTELYQVILNRGVVLNTVFVATCAFFGVINVGALVVEYSTYVPAKLILGALRN
eukprot:m.83849 g.83849  ORF g.83849 m.83849 type:complete len:587 (+) comp25679_c0_seq1:64-1824(+)